MTRKPNLISQKTKNARYIGAGLTLVATLIVFRLFFGAGLLSNAHHFFFSLWSEDLIKDVYTTTYHTKHDSSFTHCTAMAYPYGEQYTYTGLQILVSAPLQLLQKMGVKDAWKACLPLINFYIIISIFLCALFLYLLFTELKLPPAPSLFGAVFITFLMPQLQRMGGHLTLSYSCVIPMALYFIARLHHTHHWKWSVLYGMLLLISALAHPYYLTFLADISVVYMAYLLFTHKKNQWTFTQLGLHFCILFILPVLVFFILSSIGNTPLDRTTVPDGMYYYRGRLSGLLLPFHRIFMGTPIKNIMGIKAPEWETCCYIGIVALITFIVWIIRILSSIFFAYTIRNATHRVSTKIYSSVCNSRILCKFAFYLQRILWKIFNQHYRFRRALSNPHRLTPISSARRRHAGLWKWRTMSRASWLTTV